TRKLRERDNLSFDVDAAQVYNWYMPLSMIHQAARDTILPDYLRFDLLLGVWTRAILLNNRTEAVSAANEIAAATPSLAELMHQYATESNTERQQMDAIYILLKNPSLQPIIYVGYGRIER